MSIYSQQPMINNHESGFWTRLGHRFHVWADRWQQRHELTHWSDRDLHDVGVSRSDILHETEKPFWRA